MPKAKYDAHADLLRVATELRDAFHYDQGHSDLYGEQPIHISTTLGTWRRLDYALNVINAEKK